MRRRTLQGIFVVVCAVMLAGIAGATAATQTTGTAETDIDTSLPAIAVDESDQPVTISSPASDTDFNESDAVPIELDLDETDTATVTVGDLDVVDMQLDVTVRDTDDSDTVTVYFTPSEFNTSTNGFSAGDGTELVETDGEFPEWLGVVEDGVYDVTAVEGSTPYYEQTAEPSDTSKIRLVTQQDNNDLHFFQPSSWFISYEHDDQIPIELELRGNETTTVTMSSNDQDVRINATLRDTDDSDSVRAYFVPSLVDNTHSGFSAGSGTELVDTEAAFDDDTIHLTNGSYAFRATDGSTPYEEFDDIVGSVPFVLGDPDYDPTEPPGVSPESSLSSLAVTPDEQIPIELDVRHTSTATVTVGDIDSSPIQLDATVRDTDDSGSVTVFFTPENFEGSSNGFSAGDGTEIVDRQAETAEDATIEPGQYSVFYTPGDVAYHERDRPRVTRQNFDITGEAAAAEFVALPPGEEFDQTEQIPFELELTDTDTGTVTVGDLDVDNVRFDAAVRDTDDSGSVTVYFTPAEFDGDESGFEAGEGTELLETDGEFDERLSTLADGGYDVVAAPGEEPHHAEEAHSTDRTVVGLTELVETVAIDEPEAGTTVDDEISIDLDLRATESGTVTFGNLDADNVRFDATVRDTDDSGTATVSFDPDAFDGSTDGFSAGEGTELVDTDGEFDESLSALDPGAYDLVTAPGDQPHHTEDGETTDRAVVELTAADNPDDSDTETDDDASDDADDDGAGFGLAAAILAIGSLLVLARCTRPASAG